MLPGPGPAPIPDLLAAAVLLLLLPLAAMLLLAVLPLLLGATAHGLADNDLAVAGCVGLADVLTGFWGCAPDVLLVLLDALLKVVLLPIADGLTSRRCSCSRVLMSQMGLVSRHT